MIRTKAVVLIIVVILSTATVGVTYQTGLQETKTLESVTPWHESETTIWHPPLALLSIYGSSIYTGTYADWYVWDAATQTCYQKYKSSVDAFFDFGDKIIEKYNSMFGLQYLGKMTIIVTAGTNPSDNANCLDGGGSSFGTTATVGISNFWQGDHGMGYIILAHEVMNNWYGNVVGGGWPCDWWADGASPFPYMTASLAMIDLNYQVPIAGAVSSATAGQQHLDALRSDPLVYGFFFQHIYQQLGGNQIAIFARLFNAMRSDGFTPGMVKDDWLSPGAYTYSKTSYVLGYLSGVATVGQFINQGSAARAAGIGSARQLSPSPCKGDGNYPPYPVDDSVIAAIWQKRVALQSLPKSDPQWQAFLNGDYKNSGGRALIVKACLDPADISCSDLGASVKVTYVDMNGAAQTKTITTPQTVQVKAGSQYTVDFQSKTGYAFSYWNKWGAQSGFANPFIGPADNDWTLIANLKVVVGPYSWSMDLVNTNTGASIANQQVPVGTHISFKGRLTQGGQAVANTWIPLNLFLVNTGGPESGSQCWIGSSQTDNNGYFVTDPLHYLEVRSDGFWTTYRADGYSDGYIQARNGAGNPGCSAWAAQNPSGKSYYGYGAQSKTDYSSPVGFQVAEIFDFSMTWSGPISVAQGASGSNTLTVTKTTGSATTVALVSCSGMPSGTPLWAFNPSSGLPNPSFQSQLTIATLASTPADSYQVTCIAWVGAGDWQKTSPAFTVTVTGQGPPNPPTLISPTNGAIGVSVTPTLQWSSVSGAASYIVQIWYLVDQTGCSTGNTQIIFDQRGYTGTSITVTSSTLQAGKCYAWWVYSQNSAGQYGGPSTLWVFKTQGVSSFDFSLANSGGIAVQQGSSGSNTITVTLIQGTSQQVSLSASGLPSGASAAFSPSTGNPIFSSTLTIFASSSTVAGSYAIMVTGTGGGLTRTTQFTLTVTAQQVSFILSNSGSITVEQGKSAANVISVALQSGSAPTVTLSASGLPSGASASFSPSSGTPTFTSTLTIAAGASTPTGSYTITVTGTGGGLTRTTQFTLTITSAPPQIQASYFIVQQSGQAMQIQNGQTIKWPMSAPAAFRVQITQVPSVTIYAVRVVVDGAQYPMGQNGPWIYDSSWITLSLGTHNVRFEYQTLNGGPWGSLGLLETQSQETGLGAIFSSIVALVSNNWLVSSGLILILMIVAIIIIWRRRR